MAAALADGRCQDVLNVLRPSVGDCIFLPAGTVHALGEGLLVAEIQQSSDVTYRLFDWNRPGPDGRLRPLHVDQALTVVDFDRGPVDLQSPTRTERPEVERLVACDRFVLDRCRFDARLSIGGDRRSHVIAVLEGAVRIEGDPSNAPLHQGDTALLPASVAAVPFSPQRGTILLDAYLP